METFEFKPIGFLKSVFKTRFGTPRQPLQVQGATAELTLRKDLQPEQSLQGLEGFSHIWLIFAFHTNTNKTFRTKVHPPRLEGKTIGAFASRTPHRPNPIGLSLVRLEKIKDGTLYLSGVDLIDGTPILDIKPYLKYVESQPNAVDGWVESHPQTKLRVSFYSTFENDIKNLDSTISASEIDELRNLIIDVLEKDPRPLVYKESNKYLDEHAVYLGAWDVHFRVDVDSLLVTKITKAKPDEPLS